MSLIQRKESLTGQLKPGQVILDIESTGLDPSSKIYLVGLLEADKPTIKEGKEKGLCQDQPSLLFRQILALPEDDSSEKDLLEVLLDQMKDKTILTYNGEAFDLPLIKKRANLYGLALPPYQSIDFYPGLRKRKKFYPFPSLKLESLEEAAGIQRVDQLTGAQVAGAASLVGENPEVRDRVLLHNQEDVLNLHALLPFFKGLQEKETFWIKKEKPVRILGAKWKKDFLYLDLSSQEDLYIHYPSRLGRLDLEGRKGQASLPIKKARAQGQDLAVTLSPTGRKDKSPYQIKAPLLVLADPKRFYIENICSFMEDLLGMIK